MKTLISLMLIFLLLLTGCTNVQNTNQEEIKRQENLEKELEQNEKKIEKRTEETAKIQSEYETSWDDHEHYDYIAYKVSTRSESKRKGNLEYSYDSYYLSPAKAKMYKWTTDPIGHKEDDRFSFWRFDVDFIPKRGDVILVKFPKGNHDTFEDIRVIYSPIGGSSGDW